MRTQWTITKDNTAEPGATPGTNINAVGTVGPHSATLTAAEIVAHPDAKQFRLLDDDGRIPLDRMAAATNWVESIRGIYADIASNVVYHVVVSNGHWLIQEVE